MINKIFKYVTSTLVLVMIILSVVYYAYPTVVYKTARNIVFQISQNIDPPSAYDTEYGVHPILLEKVKLIIAEAKSKGIDLRVVSGFRDSAKQQMLYNKGRTTKGGIVTNAPPGLSYHNYGWAVDVCEFRNGKPYWKSKHWKEIGRIGKKHGLVWGGDWTRLVDRPHLQLTIFDILTKVII